MVRPGIEDDAGPHGEVNLAANLLYFDPSQCGRPPSFDGSQKLTLQHRPRAGDPSNKSIGAEPAPKSEVAPPPAFTTPVVHDVADLHAPGPQISLGCEGRCEGDGEQSARFGGEDASAHAAAVTPSTMFAGNRRAAMVGRAEGLHHGIY